MFQLADGRRNVYQWDINVKLLLDESNESADEVHFSARFSRVSLSVEVVHTEDSSYVTIPNILLQKPNDIIAYSYITNADGSYTKYDTIIPVIARPKPSGYVYEETEILTWKTLDNKIDDLREISSDAVKYTEQELTDEQKSQARTNIGAVSVDEVPEQVQGDWLQNDNTAPDFVKNRTHYEEVVFTELIPETTVTIKKDGGFATFQIDQQLLEGETYFVTLNGTNYECIARYYSDWDCVLIGNGTIAEADDAGNGEPFCCDSYSDGLIYLNVATAGEYTFSISGNVTVVHKINDKFVNIDGFVRTFDYHFSNYSLYKVMYDDNGDSCILYTCKKIILPETNSQLFGFMSETGFSMVGATKTNACFVTGYTMNAPSPDNLVEFHIKSTILGTNIEEMEDIAADYGYVHTTNPNA